MTTVQSDGTRNASRTAAPKQFSQLTTGPKALSRFEDIAGISPDGLNTEELKELVALDEFLSRHVRPDMLRDVQCMLLWSEWVRVFRKQTREFPRVILEKEFSEAVTNKLGPIVTEDGFRGLVYAGIRFVP